MFVRGVGTGMLEVFAQVSGKLAALLPGLHQMGEVTTNLEVGEVVKLREIRPFRGRARGLRNLDLFVLVGTRLFLPFVV